MHRQLARNLRRKPTDAEHWLWQHLRLRQMAQFKFRRQHPIGQYIVDFICLEAGLIIEIDGGQHNEEKNNKADVTRTQWLEKQGFTVLRFWNNEVLANITAVKETIWNVFDHPHPSPPPGRGRESFLSSH